MKHPYLQTGKIVSTHGVHGEVKLLPWADGPEFLLQFHTLYLDGKAYQVEQSRVQKTCVLLKLEGVDTVEAASALRDKVVSIARADAKLPEGSLFIADLLGLPVYDGETLLGTLASRRLYGPFSHAVTVVTLIGWSMPVFWLGILLLIAFAWVFPVFPVSGMFTVGLEGGFWTRALDVGRHIALPMFTLSFIYIAQYALLARSVMVEVLGADYIRTARAKGLPERSVIWKHALRNAVLPVVTMAGLQMGYLLSGAIMVETVFSWPGLGQLAFESILRRDTPTILGILFFSTFMVIAANLLTDFACRLLDPRIRAER